MTGWLIPDSCQLPWLRFLFDVFISLFGRGDTRDIVAGDSEMTLMFYAKDF